MAAAFFDGSRLPLDATTARFRGRGPPLPTPNPTLAIVPFERRPVMSGSADAGQVFPPQALSRAAFILERQDSEDAPRAATPTAPTPSAPYEMMRVAEGRLRGASGERESRRRARIETWLGLRDSNAREHDDHDPRLFALQDEKALLVRREAIRPGREHVGAQGPPRWRLPSRAAASGAPSISIDAPSGHSRRLRHCAPRKPVWAGPSALVQPLRAIATDGPGAARATHTASLSCASRSLLDARSVWAASFALTRSSSIIGIGARGGAREAQSRRENPGLDSLQAHGSILRSERRATRPKPVRWTAERRRPARRRRPVTTQ